VGGGEGWRKGQVVRGGKKGELGAQDADDEEEEEEEEEEEGEGE